MMSYIKAKVDYIAAQSGKGRFVTLEESLSLAILARNLVTHKNSIGHFKINK